MRDAVSVADSNRLHSAARPYESFFRCHTAQQAHQRSIVDENIISIDTDSVVSADSRLLLNAMRSVTGEEGYQEKLESVLDRISAIESLGRTREIFW